MVLASEGCSNSEISKPADKRQAPSPVRTTTRTAGSSCQALSRSCSSSRSWIESALRLSARCRLRVAIPSSAISKRMVSVSLARHCPSDPTNRCQEGPAKHNGEGRKRPGLPVAAFRSSTSGACCGRCFFVVLALENIALVVLSCGACSCACRGVCCRGRHRGHGRDHRRRAAARSRRGRPDWRSCSGSGRTLGSCRCVP